MHKFEGKKMCVQCPKESLCGFIFFLLQFLQVCTRLISKCPSFWLDTNKRWKMAFWNAALLSLRFKLKKWFELPENKTFTLYFHIIIIGLGNYPQKTKMTQTLTTIGHRTAFNSEQSPYRIVSNKRTRIVKQCKREN